MRRRAVLSFHSWFVLLVLLALGGVAFTGCAPSEPPPAAPDPTEPTPEPPPEPPDEARTVYFAVGFPTVEDYGRFVIALDDPATIEAAREAIADPENNPSSVLGLVVKSPARYNPGWSYHLDPSTIELFENAIEVCDAAPQYVEDHLDEVCGAFLPDCRWCPWTSQVVAELTAAEVGVDEVGVDEVGVDEVGVDEVGVDEVGADALEGEETPTDETSTDAG